RSHLDRDERGFVEGEEYGPRPARGALRRRLSQPLCGGPGAGARGRTAAGPHPCRQGCDGAEVYGKGDPLAETPGLRRRGDRGGKGEFPPTPLHARALVVAARGTPIAREEPLGHRAERRGPLGPTKRPKICALRSVFMLRGRVLE